MNSGRSLLLDDATRAKQGGANAAVPPTVASKTTIAVESFMMILWEKLTMGYFH